MTLPKLHHDRSPPHKVLIVEDEMLIALMLKDMVTENGLTVEAIAKDLSSGLELARTSSIDLAILDINLNGKEAYPIADLLQKRGIPYIFSTGYGDAAIKDGFNHVTRIDKPFQQHNLVDAIANVLGYTAKLAL